MFSYLDCQLSQGYEVKKEKGAHRYIWLSCLQSWSLAILGYQCILGLYPIYFSQTVLGWKTCIFHPQRKWSLGVDVSDICQGWVCHCICFQATGRTTHLFSRIFVPREKLSKKRKKNLQERKCLEFSPRVHHRIWMLVAQQVHNLGKCA